MKIVTVLLFLVISTTLKANIINIPLDQPTIQAGIDIANIGDTVLVQPNIYIENINFNGKSIIVASLFMSTGDTFYIAQTAIDGNQNGSVVTFESGEDSTSVLDGFTLTNGQGQGLPNFTGGGITCINASSPVLSNLMITENSTSNNFGRGGGVYCEDNSSPTIMNVQIYGNSAETGGGGIYLSDNSNPNLINVCISGNISSLRAGGLYCNANSNPRLFQVKITDNVAANSGGGIFCTNSNPIIINATVANNSSANEGGGIYCDGSHPVSVNSILWNNLPDQVFLFPDPVPSSFTAIHSDVEGGWSGMGNINLDPLFKDAANGIYNLTENSPCIDAGIAFFVLEGDTLINLSPDKYNGSAPDMGAFEFDPNSDVVDLSSMLMEFKLYQNYPNPFNPSTTIRYSIPSAGDVKLIVYNSLGEKVSILVDEFKDAGTYEVEFNSHFGEVRNLSSGIYFYKIISNNYSLVKKMILLK